MLAIPGGFAHVYVVLVGAEQLPAVLKRVACPDKDSLRDLENEIQFMVRSCKPLTLANKAGH